MTRRSGPPADAVAERDDLSTRYPVKALPFTPMAPPPAQSNELRQWRQRLLDVYGPMLTDHQREACHLYLDEDWSFSELAEQLSVSRAGAHDLVQRALAQLDRMEANLGHAAELMRRDEVEAELRGRAATRPVAKAKKGAGAGSSAS